MIFFKKKHVSFWKPYSRQRVNCKRIFLKMDIIHDLFESRHDFNYKYALSKMLQHSSPSALTLWWPQENRVSNAVLRGAALNRHVLWQNKKQNQFILNVRSFPFQWSYKENLHHFSCGEIGVWNLIFFFKKIHVTFGKHYGCQRVNNYLIFLKIILFMVFLKIEMIWITST